MTQTPPVLLYNLVTGRFSRLDGFDELKNRFKFALRSALTLPWTLKWLGTFSKNNMLMAFLRQNPRIASKLHRPYLYQTLDTIDKLAILQTHYRIECSRFPKKQLRMLLEESELPLATIVGKDEQPYRFILTHQHTFDKEGELSLQMKNAAGVSLVKITFTLCETKLGQTLMIGGLQGPRIESGEADHIKLATKACHGLFPKRVAMEALIVLARMLGMQSVQAVCKHLHIYNSWRYRKSFEADYDAFWKVLDAPIFDDDFFNIPLHLARKPFEEIASKKRSEYHRRYQLLDELSAQVASSLL